MISAKVIAMYLAGTALATATLFGLYRQTGDYIRNNSVVPITFSAVAQPLGPLVVGKEFANSVLPSEVHAKTRPFINRDRTLEELQDYSQNVEPKVPKGYEAFPVYDLGTLAAAGADAKVIGWRIVVSTRGES